MYNVARDLGGGATVKLSNGNVVIALAPEGNLTNNPPHTVPGVNGSPVPDPVGIIAGHELLGHGVDHMTGVDATRVIGPDRKSAAARTRIAPERPRVMKHFITLLLAYLLVGSVVSAKCCAQSCDPTPQLTITDVHLYKHKGVRLQWKLVNHGSQPIFVYSTFLEGRHRAAEWMKRPDGVFEIHTSLSHKLDMQVNYYPKATFVKIEPNSERIGSFDDPDPTVRLAKADRVLFTIAYGADVESVQQALKLYYNKGTGHPANPIVDWQCIAMSNILQVR